MPTVAVAIVLLCGSIAAVAEHAAGLRQSAGFSGDWVLASISPERPGYDHFWLGTETTVRHDGASLTITRVSPAPQTRGEVHVER